METYVLKYTVRFVTIDDPTARQATHRILTMVGECLKDTLSDLPLVEDTLETEARCVRHGDRTNRDILTGKSSVTT